MPLIKGKSKPAFEHNIKVEMEHGKPQKQALAIAYATKRRSKKKKMASGGSVESGSPTMNYAEGGEISAKSERRPMPSQRFNDSKELAPVMQKPASEDKWTDNPTVRQAQKPSLTRLSRPKIIGSDTYSVRDRAEIEADEHRMSSEAPDGYGRQPKKSYDEQGPDRQGPESRDLHMKRMAEGGRVEDPEKRRQHDIERKSNREAMKKASMEIQERPLEKLKHIPEKKYAEGGNVDLEQSKKPMPKQDKPPGNTLDYKELRKQYAEKNRKKYAEGGMLHPEDEYSVHIDEENDMSMDPEQDHDPMMSPLDGEQDDMQPVDDYMSGRMEAHNYAEGGEIDREHELDAYEPIHDNMYNDDEEDEIDKAASIASAIMAKKAMKMYADGGMVDLDSNEEEQPNGYYERNEDAALKENYDEDMDDMHQPLDSNEDGRMIDEDEHDHIDKMRKRMKMKSAFTK